MSRCIRIAERFRWFSLSGRAGLAVIMIVVAMAVFAPWLSMHSPDHSSGPPLAPPGKTHILGTDELGVDLWARICFGSRISLAAGMATALIAGIGGAIAGMFAAVRQGMADRVLMRVIDTMMVLPGVPVIIVLAAFAGPGLVTLIVVLSLFSWAGTARIVRAQVLMLKTRDYIRAARLYGAGTRYLITKHLLPEVSPLVAVSMIRLTGKAVVAEAGLSFLGLGDPASGSWGLIIYHAMNFKGIYYTEFWKWWLLAPVLALILLVSSLAFIGRDLERLV